MTHPRKGDDWEIVEDIDDSLLISTLDKIDQARQYPDASYAILHHSVEYTFSLPKSEDNSPIKCTRTDRKIVLILNERGKNMNASQSFHYLAPYQNADIDFCRTITPDGRIYHLDDSALEFAEPNQYYPQYNYLRRIKFAPPQISIQSIVDMQYHIDYDIVDALHPTAVKMIFGGDEPILLRKLTVRIPQGLPENFIRYYGFSPPDEYKKDNEKILVWQMENIAPTIKETWSAPAEMYLPTIWVGFAVDEAKVLRALSDSLAQSLDGSPVLDSTINSLLAGYDTPQEKLNRIYEYLNLSFRHCNIGPAQSLWFPRKVSEIFDDGIANRLDLSALMCYMLKKAGIESRLLYSSKVVDSDAIETVPTLSFFDIPMVSAKIDDEWTFHYPNRKYLPPGIIPNNCVGQQALWVSPSYVQMAQLPFNSISEYAIVETLWIKLSSQGDADVEQKKCYGNVESQSIRHYREVPVEQVDKYFQISAGKFHPGANLIEYSIIGINSLDSTVIAKDKLFAPELAQSAGEKLLAFQLPRLEYKPSSYGQPTRKTPIWFWSPQKRQTVWIVELPPKFKPKYIPEPVTITLDSMNYSLNITYEDKSNTLIAIADRIFTDRFIPAESYPQLRDAMFRWANISKNWIIMEK